MSDRVNLVAPASPFECLLYLPNVQAIQYELGVKLKHIKVKNICVRKIIKIVIFEVS